MTFEQLADILCDMVAQSCSTRIPDEVDSSCIGTHAEAIEALIELGYAERVGPSAGRQIRARLIPPEERRATRPLTAVDFNQLRGDELRQRLRAEAAERRLEEAERKLDAAVPPSAYAGASQPQISEIITAAFHSIPTRATRRHRRLLDAVKAYEAENERLRWVVSALRDQLRQTCTVTGWADLVSDLEKLGSVKLAMRIAFAVGKDEGARAAYADLASFTEAKAGEVAHNRHASFQRAAEGKMSMANHPAQRVEWTIDAIRQIVAKGAEWRGLVEACPKPTSIRSTGGALNE